MDKPVAYNYVEAEAKMKTLADINIKQRFELEDCKRELANRENEIAMLRVLLDRANGYDPNGNHIVQVVHLGGYGQRYTFNVPEGMELKKGDIVLVEKKGKNPKVAECVTDSITVNDEVLDMIMCGNKVISTVIGKYVLRTDFNKSCSECGYSDIECNEQCKERTE